MPRGAAYDIPLELLTYIFTIARRDVTERGSWTEPSSDAYELGLALCGVCRHFRRTVRGMPEFWDMISVSGRGHNRAFRRLLTCMAVVPEALLDIRFHISLSSYTDEDEEDHEDRTIHDDEPNDHRARFFNAIAAQAHRVRRLQFCFKFEAEWQAMTSCFQYAYAPFLEYLAINAKFRVGSNNDDDLDKEIPPASLFKGGAPNLRQVHIHGLGFTRATTPVSNLTTLVIADPNFNTADSFVDLEALLGDAYRLRVLHLYGERWFDTCGFDWTVGAPKYRKICAPWLRELKLDDATECFIDIFQVPYLAKLILDGTNIDKFSECLVHSRNPQFPRLVHLVLDDFLWEYVQAEECRIVMKKIPTIQHLTITSRRSWAKNDRVIIEVLTDHVLEWPSLHTLEISGIDKGPLMKLIHARRAHAPIKTLVVPDSFLAVMRTHSLKVVEEIEKLGLRIHARPPIEPGFDQEGGGYWESWGRIPLEHFVSAVIYLRISKADVN
jgi:hypothetical protein